MPLSTDVTLDSDTTPKFPNKCLVCHSRPDDSVRIAHNSSNWFLGFFLPILMLFGWSRVELPVCRGCKLRFRAQRWSRELVSWAVIIIAVWYMMPYFSEWSSFTKKIVVGALAVCAVAPMVMAEVFWPRIFDTTAQGKMVDYEFADADYALEFYAVNREHVIKSDISDSAPASSLTKIELLEAFSDLAFKKLAKADDRMEQLEEPYQTVVTIYSAQGVIDNGGMVYFFENDWPHHQPYSDFADAYERIGRHGAAEALRHAADSFEVPNPERDKEARREYIKVNQSRFDGMVWDDCICGDKEVFPHLADWVLAHYDQTSWESDAVAKRSS